MNDLQLNLPLRNNSLVLLLYNYKLIPLTLLSCLTFFISDFIRLPLYKPGIIYRDVLYEI